MLIRYNDFGYKTLFIFIGKNCMLYFLTLYFDICESLMLVKFWYNVSMINILSMCLLSWDVFNYLLEKMQIIDSMNKC